MFDINPSPPIRGCVTAIFEDGPHSFVLTKGATLEGLSSRLATLRRQHCGKLLDVTVRFGTTFGPGDARRPRRTSGKDLRISG